MNGEGGRAEAGEAWRELNRLDTGLVPDADGRLGSAPVERALVTAIQEGVLPGIARSLLALPAGTLTPDAEARARTAFECCERIARTVGRERTRMVDRIRSEGLRADPVSNSGHSVPSGLQFHRFEVRVDPGSLDPVLAICAAEGYRRWVAPTPGAWASFRRTRSQVGLVRTDEVTTRMVVRWGDPEPPSRLFTMLRPRVEDYDVVDLPDRLWWAYPAVKPLGSLRRWLRGRAGAIRAPFLGTPAELLPSLYDFAGVGPDDLLVDLGCGDGRVVVGAARSRGCRAVGVERDPRLVALARSRVADAGLEDRVDIRRDDAVRADIAKATVVFLFLPAPLAVALLPGLRRRLGPEGRVVAHEQTSFTGGPTADRTEAIIGSGALTVARLWSGTGPADGPGHDEG